jgi:hypothetical protein
MELRELEELNKWLANEVMGFDWDNPFYKRHPKTWQDEGYGFRDEDEWTPTTDLNQTMECVEKLDSHQLELLPPLEDVDWECNIYIDLEGEFSGVGSSPALAICKAIKKVYNA